MGIFKIYFFFHFSYWLHLLLIVCGDVESIPGPCSDKRVRVLYSNIRGIHANLDELAVAQSDYDVLVCAESKVFEPPSLRATYPIALVAPSRGCGTLLLVPRAWLFMLGKDSAPSFRTSWSVLAMNPVCFVFAVG